MALSVIAAICVVTLPNLFHSALSLVVTLIGIAAIYIALHAEFLAVVQVLLYVGAVMTLIIFSIMLTTGMGNKSIQQFNPLSLPAFAAAIVFVVVLAQIIFRTPWPVKPETVAATVSTADLGKAMMGLYVFPFEVISVILIAALIGAITIAREDKEKEGNG